MNGLRVAVVYHEMPYPVNHGGRLDVWSRLQALADLGVEIHLVCWKNAHLGEGVPAADSPIWKVVKSATVLDEKGRLANSHLAMSLPGYARRRLPDAQGWARVVKAVTAFQPDAILLEGPFGFPTAHRLSRELGVDFIYRSHNVEARYARLILEKSVGWKDRLEAFSNVMGVEKMESSILANARRVFDISQDDVQYWKARGVEHIEWLPSVVGQAWAEQISTLDGWHPEFDFGYLGNLYQPNNVHGVTWFLQEVLPLLRSLRPGIRGFIAGSRPADSIRAAIDQAGPGVRLIENPPDVIPILRNAKVLINPVFAGSGVNTKCIEMLFTPAALVATSTALNGLPDAVRACFGMADQPRAFAELMIRGLDPVDPNAQRQDRDQARSNYDFRQLRHMVDVLAGMKAKQPMNRQVSHG